MFIVIKDSHLRLQASNGAFVRVDRWISLDDALAKLRTGFKACRAQGNDRGMAAYVEVANYIKAHPNLLMAMDAEDDDGLMQFIDVIPF